MTTLLLVLHILAAVMMIVVIIIQPGKSEGISGVFGTGSTQTIFGTRANTFLTRLTAGLALVFLVTSMSLAMVSGRRGKSLLDEAEQAAPGPGAATSTATENVNLPPPVTAPVTAPVGTQEPGN